MQFESTDARFEFGENWARFLTVLDDDRIRAAERSLREMLGVEHLQGRSFLDIGSGSGLSSLAARQMGATVHSFDFDPRSVACTAELRRRFFPDDASWVIEQGSALDIRYLSSLGTFDVVYSWGVLHHTGAMWLGIENSINCVADDGQLFIAIYNDQGYKSRIWWLVKWFYTVLPRPLNTIYGYTLGLVAKGVTILKYTVLLRPMTAIRPLRGYKQSRGMSVMHDLIDWMGGFPYEFASFEVLETYLKARGFKLVKGKRATSLGCHEMIFRRVAAAHH